MWFMEYDGYFSSSTETSCVPPFDTTDDFILQENISLNLIEERSISSTVCTKGFAAQSFTISARNRGPLYSKVSFRKQPALDPLTPHVTGCAKVAHARETDARSVTRGQVPNCGGFRRAESNRSRVVIRRADRTARLSSENELSMWPEHPMISSAVC